MPFRRLAPFALFLAVSAVVYFTTRAPATSAEAPYDGEPEIVAATFASAWCSSCRVLKPKLAKVIPAFKNEPVAFVEFDFTFGPNDDIRAEAEDYGVEDIYDRNKGATGFTVLVDHDTGEIIDTLTMNFSEAAMKAAIAQAIAIASHTDDKADKPVLTAN